MGKVIDLTGQKFGELLVLGLAPERKSNRVTWRCKCSCGNEVDVISSHLKSGHTRSCGCLQRKASSQMNPAIDISGQRFGRLIALRRAPSRGSHTYWVCQCDCGNTCEVRTNSLKNGHTTSCGCIQSTGEEKIALWLMQHNIPFERQKTFSTCRNPQTNHLLRFDFFIDNRILLEYDGIHHFQANGGWNDEAYQIGTEYRDSIKNDWAKENNILLYRISNNECYSQEKLEETLQDIFKER